LANKYSKAKLEKFKKAIAKKMGSVSDDIETIKEHAESVRGWTRGAESNYSAQN